MIVQNGQLKLLEEQLEYLDTLQYGLFTANYTVVATSTAANVTASEATWAGYARQTATGWQTPTTVSGSAQSSPPVLVTFNNTSGASVTFYGWFALDPSDGSLVAALNIGLVTIPTGSPYSFSPAITDTNTGP